MLVLSRRVFETILVGDIVVKVIEIKNGRVRLGIEADRAVRIVRQEIAEKGILPC